MEKSEPWYTADGNENGIVAVENSLAVLQKVQHRVTIRPSILLLSVYSTEMKT